jgi:hypothetical protein
MKLGIREFTVTTEMTLKYFNAKHKLDNIVFKYPVALIYILYTIQFRQ